MCFCNFLRSGEVVVPLQSGYDLSCHLCYGDVLVDNTKAPTFLEVGFEERPIQKRGIGVPRGDWRGTLPQSGLHDPEGLTNKGPSYLLMDPFSLESDFLTW